MNRVLCNMLHCTWYLPACPAGGFCPGPEAEHGRCSDVVALWRQWTPTGSRLPDDVCGGESRAARRRRGNNHTALPDGKRRAIDMYGVILDLKSVFYWNVYNWKYAHDTFTPIFGIVVLPKRFNKCVMTLTLTLTFNFGTLSLVSVLSVIYLSNVSYWQLLIIGTIVQLYESFCHACIYIVPPFNDIM